MQMQQHFKAQQSMGYSDERESDTIKRMFLETNPILLAITLVVCMYGWMDGASSSCVASNSKTKPIPLCSYLSTYPSIYVYYPGVLSAYVVRYAGVQERYCFLEEK